MKRIFLEILIPLLLLVVLWACQPDDHRYLPLARASVAEMKQHGLDFLDAGKMDSALMCFTVAAGKYRPEMPDSLKNICASAANNAGYLYLFRFHDYLSAYSWLLRALEIADETGNKSTLPYAYLNIGNIYVIYKDNESALRYHKTAFRSAVEVKNWPIAITSISNLIAMRQKFGTEIDISHELAMLDKMDIPPTPMLEYTRAIRRAVEMMEHEQWTEALEQTQRARQLIDSPLTPERFRWGCDGLEATILAKTGKPQDALATLTRIDGEAAKYGEIDSQSEAAETKAQIYSSLSQWAEALREYRRSKELNDSLFNSQNYGTIRDVSANFQLRKLNNKVAEVEVRRSRTFTALLWAGVAIVILAILGLVFYLQNKKLRFSNQQLFERNQEMIALSQEAKRSRNVYRERIEQMDNDTSDRERGNQLDELARQELMDKINNALDDVDTISSTDFSLSQLAKLVGSNHNYVSQAINDGMGKNFSTLLAEKRVLQACIRLADTAHYGNLTVEAIANGLGFRSRSNFASLFKKITGLTPTEYRRQAEVRTV